jgi:hypothetical protein
MGWGGGVVLVWRELDGSTWGGVDGGMCGSLPCFDVGLRSWFLVFCCGDAVVTAGDVSTCCVGGSLAWCSCCCCCEKGKMEKRLALRLCLFGALGRCSWRRVSCLLRGLAGGGCDAEWVVFG